MPGFRPKSASKPTPVRRPAARKPAAKPPARKPAAVKPKAAPARKAGNTPRWMKRGSDAAAALRAERAAADARR